MLTAFIIVDGSMFAIIIFLFALIYSHANCEFPSLFDAILFFYFRKLAIAF